MQTRRKIFVALRMAGVAGQDKLAGIFRYLGEHYGDDSPWDIRLVRTRNDLTPAIVRQALEDGTEGFILSIPDTEDAAAELARVEVPAAVMDIHTDVLANKPNLVFIRNAGEAIGRTAARYLMSIGVFRSYAFVHMPDIVEWSVSREAAFRETLRDNGHWCDVFPPEGGDLADFIKGLKKPAGVFAANDDRGFDILETCHKLGLRVPKDVAVLGINNDTLICEHCHPPLSSIQPDFESEGYLAAEALDRMLSDGSRPAGPDDARTLYVGVKQIVRRSSTAEVSHAGLLVQKAIAFIDRNATKGIAVPDVVRHLKCSRRLADLRFRELQHESIGEAILSRKLEAVKDQLLHSHDTIEHIAERCGFKNTNSLKNTFKRRFHMTMRDFRKQ